MKLFTIAYDMPTEPGKYVLRAFSVSAGGVTEEPDESSVHDTLEAVRASLPGGGEMVRVGNHTQSCPYFVEAWL